MSAPAQNARPEPVSTNPLRRVAFELQTTVDRREFGIVWQNQLPDGSDALAYDVTISADLQLVKQA